MVLENAFWNYPNYRILILSICLSSICSSCTYQNNLKENSFDNGYLTTVEVNNKKIKVVKDGDNCKVKYGSSSLKLDLPHPCGFVRYNNLDEAKYYYYKGKGYVFILAGPKVEDFEYLDSYKIRKNYMCSNYGLAIILNNNQIVADELKKIHLGFCHNLAPDEKDYHGTIL